MKEKKTKAAVAVFLAVMVAMAFGATSYAGQGVQAAQAVAGEGQSYCAVQLQVLEGDVAAPEVEMMEMSTANTSNAQVRYLCSNCTRSCNSAEAWQAV